MKTALQKVNPRYVGAGAFLSGLLATTSQAFATTTYDLSPVTTSVTSELAGNMPVILAIVGGLIALGVGIRAIRKFAKV
jgi:hypothetical protein